MGASDSKLQFKNHVFRLFEESDIAANDQYWVRFWQQPENASDIFTLFTASDVRQTRDLHIENLETLILALTSRLFYLFDHESFPSVELAPPSELLNCLRLLTRLIPFIHERKDERMVQWGQKFFWGRRRVRSPATSPANEDPGLHFDETASLAEKLIDTGFALLFYSGFTIPRQGREKVVYSIWETGVGSSTPQTTTHEMLSNRIEVLRFLLALFSDCLYTTPTELATDGSRYLTYAVTKQDKRMTMAVLCSLLNVTLKYYPGWKVPYEYMIISDRQKQFVIYSVQLLELLLLYLVPTSKDDTKASKNMYRHFLSKIHRVQDLQFIADSLTKLLSQPIQASASYLPGSKREIEWISELTQLFWDLIQCNRKFKAYLISSNRIHDFTILLQYYIHEKRSDTSKQGFLKLCTYILLYLSADPSYAKSLTKRFEGQSALPTAIKLPFFNGNYADYLIIQLLKSISISGDSLDFLVATFLDIAFNISPYITDISYPASSSLLSLLNTLSSQSFYLANERNQYILGTLLQTFTLLINCNFRTNSHLVFALLRNLKALEGLQESIEKQIQNMNDGDDFVLDDQEATAKSKNKGKGKVREEEPRNITPKDAIKARLSEIWVILDPLIINLRAISHAVGFDASRSGGGEPHRMVERIAVLAPEQIPGANLEAHEPTSNEFEAVKFYWDSSSLGWYQSILWGMVYQREHDVETSPAITDAAANIVSINTASNNVGVWNGTDIKLFRLQEVAPRGPTLMKPKGAVDALADNVIHRIERLRNRND